MTANERRFNDTEIATILERAAAKHERAQLMPSADGLTLAQLQDVGREVGIEPHVVAEMAATIDDRTVTRRSFGLPMRVERRIPLARELSDQEWERVVVDLREIFEARGVLKRDGSLRQWTNGNLQALVEPTANGQRIRIRTFKESAVASIAIGALFAGASAVGLVTAAINGAASVGTVTPLALIGGAGAGLIAITALRLRGWAARRREQMAEIAARIAAL